MLLGKPWQFDKKVKHDGFTNKYSFVHNQWTVTLVPLTPSQVYEDQMRLQKKNEQKKKSKQNKKSENESEQKKESNRKKVTEKLREKKKAELNYEKKNREKTQFLCKGK